MKKEWNKRFLQNGEVSDWLLQLSERAKNNNIGEIHGSHDYRMKNIFWGSTYWMERIMQKAEV